MHLRSCSLPACAIGAPPAAPLVTGPVVSTVATAGLAVVLTRPAVLDTGVDGFTDEVEATEAGAFVVVLARVLVVVGLVKAGKNGNVCVE